jgi:hypothetical protein
MQARINPASIPYNFRKEREMANLINVPNFMFLQETEEGMSENPDSGSIL